MLPDDPTASAARPAADDETVPPDNLRLFFALIPPPATVAALHALAGQIAASQGGRLTRPETLHVTLAFLGQVPRARVPELLELAATLPSVQGAVRFDELAFWRAQRLYCALCREVPASLETFAGQLRQALQLGGFPVDSQHPFRPHITLVRHVPLAAAASPVPAMPALPELSWSYGDFVLLASYPGAGGTPYRTLGRLGSPGLA